MIRLEMNRKQEAILVVIVLVAALVAFAFYVRAARNQAAASGVDAASGSPPIFDAVTEQMERHSAIDKACDDAVRSGKYSITNPLLAVDPYEAAPLTALVAFQTEEPMQITVHVAGKTEDVSVSHTFDGYNTDHILPIYGLYPESVNMVEISAQTQDAQSGPSALLLIETGGVPEEFPKNLIPQQTASAHDSPPFFFTFVRKSAFDKNGDYRWYYDGFDTQYPTKYADNGNMYIIAGSIEAGDALLLEVNMLGRVVSLVPYDSAYKMEGFDASLAQRRGFYAADD